jgi:parallel beta-helix repeat protein
VISAGGQQANFTIAGNYISEQGSGSGCYGIAAGDHGYTSGGWLQNFRIENNTIVDAGNRGILLQECTDCVISSNVLIYTQSVVGIALPANAARTSVPSCTPDPITGKVCTDTPSTRGRVINNTIYSSSAATRGVTGIVAGFEGSGYVIANNSVVYMGTSSLWASSCFNYNLDASAYEFINNNHCYVPSVAYKWEFNHGGTLAAWQAYSGASSFDTLSIAGVDPKFANPGTDFTPTPGSPLLQAGSSVYKSAFDYFGIARASVPSIGAVE